MKKYHDYLIQALRDPKEAAEYLNVALEEGDRDMFLVALKNVAEAHGGMTKLSRRLKLNRPNLYRMLSKKGNPEIKTLTHVLKDFGLRLAVIAVGKEKIKTPRASCPV